MGLWRMQKNAPFTIVPDPLGPEWYYLPTPPLGQDMTQGQFLSGV